MADYKAIKLMHCWNEYCFPSWWNLCAFSYLVVWGGGSWSAFTVTNYGWWGWWWGGGEVKQWNGVFVPWDCGCITICIGCWWAQASWWSSGNCWCPSCIAFWASSVVARGWGISSNWYYWGDSWSWCTWWTSSNWLVNGWWGWAGAFGNWGNLSWRVWWNWWLGITYCGIDFGWWGWGGSWCCCKNCYWFWHWCCGWGNWWCCRSWVCAWCDATWCGGGWWGSTLCAWRWWKWWDWAALISYPTDWSWGTKCATWWDCCFVCNWCCVHMFTSDWTFTIVS